MGREHAYFSSNNGEITGHISYMTVDAVFRHEGKPVLMSFHNYLGPFFEIVSGKNVTDFSPGEEPEYEHLWKQFYGWWKAKGAGLYE